MSKTSAVAEPAAETGTENWSEYAKYRGRILFKEKLAHKIYRYIVEKPEGFEFQPGDAVELALDKEGWREEKRPFSPTSLNINPRLEFIIKSYPTDGPDEKGVTEKLRRDYEVGDRVIFDDPWSSVEYNGPGVFIAGGTGLTPFLSILRQLEHEETIDGHRLFFSNCREEDVFMQGALFRMLGRGVVCSLTEEKKDNYEYGEIGKAWLESRIDDFDQQFYVCGPPAMVDELSEALEALGASPNAIRFDE